MFNIALSRNIKLFILALGTVLFASQMLLMSRASAYTNWTPVFDQNGSVSLVCKTYQTSGFGPLWRITIAALSSPGTTASTSVTVYRGGPIASNAVTATNGQWKQVYTYASIIHGDTISAYGSNGTGASGYWGPINPSSSFLKTCA